MGRDLAEKFPVARRTFEEADEALGFSISKLCFEGPEDQLKLTEFQQPAICTVSVAALRVLAEKGIAPRSVAGHSLGEYAANVAAGSISFADAVRTVRNRGRFMQEAVPAGQGAMAAVLGLSSEETAQACTDAAAETNKVVSAANFNSPEQTVISGEAAAVERAAELAKERGAKRIVMLQVSAPFHCALMQPAQDRLAELLRGLDLLRARRARCGQCGRGPGRRPGRTARRPHPPGHRRRPLGRVGPPAHLATAVVLCRSWPGQNSRWPDAPDRPQPELREYRGRGQSGARDPGRDAKTPGLRAKHPWRECQGRSVPYSLWLFPAFKVPSTTPPARNQSSSSRCPHAGTAACPYSR